MRTAVPESIEEPACEPPHQGIEQVFVKISGAPGRPVASPTPRHAYDDFAEVRALSPVLVGRLNLIKCEDLVDQRLDRAMARFSAWT
jgi:hypothetical protein